MKHNSKKQSTKRQPAKPVKKDYLNEIIENGNDVIKRNKQVIVSLQSLPGYEDAIKNLEETNRILLEARKTLQGQLAKSKTNHCKVCLFQKLCDKFTEDGRNGLTCGQPEHNQKYLELMKQAKDDGAGAVVVTGALQVWKDTPEQLDARFGMN